MNGWWLQKYPTIFWNLMVYFGELKATVSKYYSKVDFMNVVDYVKVMSTFSPKESLDKQ